MDFQIKMSEFAEEDIDSIVEYISVNLDNYNAAERFFNNVNVEKANIKNNPYMYSVYPDEKIAELGYRRVVIGNYIMFYYIDEVKKIVCIARVFYGGQNILSEENIGILKQIITGE